MSKKLLKTIELARVLQPEKQTGRSFHLATVYDGPRLLSIGYNNYKREHLRHKYGKYKPTRDGSNYIPSRHAEISAIHNLKSPRKNLTICVIRLDRNGNIAYSHPCPNCLPLLKQLSPKKIIFSINNEEFGTIY